MSWCKITKPVSDMQNIPTNRNSVFLKFGDLLTSCKWLIFYHSIKTVNINVQGRQIFIKFGIHSMKHKVHINSIDAVQTYKLEISK